MQSMLGQQRAMHDRMNSMMSNFDQLQSNPGATCSSQSFSYSSISNRNGRDPHVIQKSSSMRRAGNVQETKESHSDSHTGVERMSVQRKLGDRTRKIVRGRNNFTGEEVQDDVSVNMDSSHGPQFDREWESAASQAGLGRLGSGRQGPQLGYQPQINMQHQPNQRRPSNPNARSSLPSHISQPGRHGGQRVNNASQRQQALPPQSSRSTRPW